MWLPYSVPFTHRSALQRDGRALVFNPEVPPMTNISSLITATAIASLFLMGAVSAQTAAPAKNDATKTEAPKAETKAPAAKKAEKPRTPGSLECSKEADEKGLKGKERKKFRNACKKEAADKEKAAGAK
jgi:psiF repeat